MRTPRVSSKLKGRGENLSRVEKPRGSGREKPAVRGVKTGKPGSGREVWYLPQAEEERKGASGREHKGSQPVGRILWQGMCVEHRVVM